MKTLSLYRPCAIAVLVMVSAVPAVAQTNQSLEPRKDASDAAFTTKLVKTGLYSISSGGSNSLLRLSQNGLIIVDGKQTGNYDLLLARIRKISDQPIRVVVLPDAHAGSNAEFLADGAGIIVQENARRNLATSASDFIEGTAPPQIVTYDREYKLRMGGVDAQLLHFGNAHTNGDTVVYFPNLKVVAVGDLFAYTPDPDFSAGGSLVGWGPVLGEILKLDFTVAIPGTGPAIARADLEAFKSKIDTLIFRATQLVKAGVPKDRLMAELKTDDLGWQFSFAGPKLDSFYAELSGTK